MKDNNPYRSTVLQPKQIKPLGNRSLSMSAWVCACLAGLLYILRFYAEMTNGMNDKLALGLGISMWLVALVGSLLSMRAMALHAQVWPLGACFVNLGCLLWFGLG